MMNLKTSEIDILRHLAQKYMNYANMPVQKEKINLWKALNRGKMERPMVCMDQLPWNELVCEDLICKIEDPFWREVEENLRMSIYKWENIPVDMVLNDFISIPKAVTNNDYGIAVVKKTMGEEGGILSQHFTSVVNKMEDVDLIKDKIIVHDENLTNKRHEEASQIFKDVAPFMMRNHTGSHIDFSFYLGLWDILSELMGIEASYINMFDDPDFVHAAMEAMTRATIACIEQANELKLHDNNTNMAHCTHIYTDDLLPESGSGKEAISQNCWGFGLAQIFTGISPDMFEEFEFQYIERLAKHFGKLYYGCCDKLDNKLHIIKRIPNVKKISCSPWSDKTNFAEKIGSDIVMSFKPNPAFLAVGSLDEASVRAELESVYDLAKANNVNVEFILKDVSTVGREPQRLRRWAEIAMEIAQK